MVNTRAPFRIFVVLTFLLTISAAANARATRAWASGVGTGLLQAAGGTMRVANSDVTFNTADGTSWTVPSYGNNRFAGYGGVGTVTAAGVCPKSPGSSRARNPF